MTSTTVSTILPTLTAEIFSNPSIYVGFFERIRNSHEITYR